MPLLDLNLIHWNREPECTATIDKHFDGYMTLQFSERAGVIVVYDSEEYHLEGTWFWPAYPGPKIRFHRATGVSSWDHRYIAFNGPLAQHWILTGLFPTRPQQVYKTDEYAQRFDEMHALVRRSGRWQHAKAANILEGILIDLAIARSQESMSEDWIGPVLARLTNEGATFDPDYAKVAASAGMAVSTLRRRFREATGMPIHAFALQCRISRARRLLVNTQTPIKAIADMLGYRDVYYFSQQFRSLVGITPGAYRKAWSGE